MGVLEILSSAQTKGAVILEDRTPMYTPGNDEASINFHNGAIHCIDTGGDQVPMRMGLQPNITIEADAGNTPDSGIQLWNRANEAIVASDDADAEIGFQGNHFDLVYPSASAAPPAGHGRLSLNAAQSFYVRNAANELCPAIFAANGEFLVPSIQLSAPEGGTSQLDMDRTNAGATKVVNGNVIARIQANGQHGSGYKFGGIKIEFRATGDWDGGSDTPGLIAFMAAPDGSGTAADMFKVQGDGKLVDKDSATVNDRRIILQDTSTTTTPSSTAQQNLMSQTIAANTLANDGDRLHVVLAGDYLTNSGTPTFIPRIIIGSNTIQGPTSAAETASATPRMFRLEFDIIRVSSSLATAHGIWWLSSKGNVPMSVMATTMTYVMSAAQADLSDIAWGASTGLSVTSQFSVANASNRMRCWYKLIELIKA